MSKTKSPYGFIRERDCYYAEKAGYSWFPLNAPKLDMQGRPFTHILCTSGYMTHVIEVDTRVPNFTTNVNDALRLAQAVGINTEKYLAMLLADVDAKLVADGSDLV